MIVWEETQVRRVLGRMERGESLVPAFEVLASRHHVRAGRIHATGALSTVSLLQTSGVHAGQKRFRQCELLSLEGTLSIWSSQSDQD